MVTKKKLKFYGKILDDLRIAYAERYEFAKSEGITLQKGIYLTSFEEIILHEFNFLTVDILLWYLYNDSKFRMHRAEGKAPINLTNGIDFLTYHIK